MRRGDDDDDDDEGDTVTECVEVSDEERGDVVRPLTEVRLRVTAEIKPRCRDRAEIGRSPRCACGSLTTRVV